MAYFEMNFVVDFELCCRQCTRFHGMFWVPLSFRLALSGSSSLHYRCTITPPYYRDLNSGIYFDLANPWTWVFPRCTDVQTFTRLYLIYSPNDVSVLGWGGPQVGKILELVLLLISLHPSNGLQ